MTERTEAVQRAAAGWSRQLVDESGRNQLVNFRRGGGSLDLTPNIEDGNAKPLDTLLSGRQTRLSRLSTGRDAGDARRSMQRVHNRASSNRDEKGIDTLFLALGVVTWPAENGRTVRAPLALLPIRASARDATRQDYNIAAAGELTLNPVLAQMLESNFAIDTDPVAQLLAEARSVEGVTEITGGLQSDWRAVPELKTETMAALGNFSYAALPMVTDLTRNASQLADSDLVAAAAGDQDARAQLQTVAEVIHPDERPTADEYLVLDADGSQQSAMERALAGQSLVIQGPPGTGKSQVIANLIAVLAANGRTSLFVAEKRAAIDAVVNRLARVDLNELVMDTHGGIRSRRNFASRIHDALQRIQRTPAQDTQELNRQLDEGRQELADHRDRRHRDRPDIGMSLHRLNERMLELGPPDQRLPAWDNAHSITGPELSHLLDQVAEWRELSAEQSTGVLRWNAARIDDAAVASSTAEIVRRAAYRLPAVREMLDGLLKGIGCPLDPPGPVDQWPALLEWLVEVHDVRVRYGPGVHGLDHNALLAGLGHDTFVLLRPFRSARKRVLSQMRGLLRQREELTAGRAMADLRRAASHLQRWPGLADTRVDTTGLDRRAHMVRSELVTLLDDLQNLSRVFGVRSLSSWNGHDLAEETSALNRNSHLAAARPRVSELWQGFVDHGLDQQLAALPESTSAREAAREVERAWLAGVWRQCLWSEPATAQFRGPGMDRRRSEYCHLDREHIAGNASRVRRAVAERAVRIMNAWPVETARLERESVRKSRHRPVRALMSDAPEVLTALWPCWAMSPVLAAELLPARADLFDVVIFDEASQVQPASAIGALGRARQAIIAGDNRQLPPTTFFSLDQVADSESDDDQLSDMESILDVARAGMLPEVMLDWHYRSADSRLVEFSNASFYGGRLVTFPGTEAQSPVTLDLLPDIRGEGSARSHPAEVNRVVDQVFDHARRTPDRSLGVIAFGIAHAEEIDRELRRRLREDATARTRDFFSEDRDEPFFIKNIERVQGDERDHVILTIGYHKGGDGRLAHRFGPLNQDGGERRLNVAASRARHRMTVVSSISHLDFDPDRSSAAGVDALRRFLEYAQNGGPAASQDTATGSPVITEIAGRLQQNGVPSSVNYGTGQGGVEVAIAHPTRENHMVLAVETDGAAYGDAPTVRDRERLKPQVLCDKGWNVHRVWTEQYLRDPETETELIISAWRDAVLETREPEPSSGPPAEAAPDPPPVRSGRQGIMPQARGGIDRYQHAELVEMARWVTGDGVLRTNRQLEDELRRQLGFRRRGRRIDEALSRAVASLTRQPVG